MTDIDKAREGHSFLYLQTNKIEGDLARFLAGHAFRAGFDAAIGLTAPHPDTAQTSPSEPQTPPQPAPPGPQP